MAYVTATVTVWDADPALPTRSCGWSRRSSRAATSPPCPKVNAVDAWLGSLPGHAYANVRQPPVSTLNLAHMIPLSAVWAGPERDEHFDAPPLLYGKTEGSTPFRFSLHVGDVGHTLVVGPTGAGKSVLLALMALQFRRYAQAQVFAFDFGGSIRAAALAMGGDWHDLGGGLTEGAEANRLAAAAGPHRRHAERAWAADWIARSWREGIRHAGGEGASLVGADLARLRAGRERTLTGLVVLLQSNDAQAGARSYCVGGPYGRLLDAEAEHLGSKPMFRRSRPKG
jgi:type IV secretory pathway VirB4 component